MGQPTLTNGRSVIIDTVSGSTDAMPLDAHKAIVKAVEDMEDRISGGETISTILVGAKIKVHLTGKNPFQIHVFDMYGDFTNADYNFEYVETVENSASAS